MCTPDSEQIVSYRSSDSEVKYQIVPLKTEIMWKHLESCPCFPGFHKLALKSIFVLFCLDYKPALGEGLVDVSIHGFNNYI